ncbi:hypothetical protein ACGFWI_10120 [Streptomyces sp. NPDC048434]|uniref:hypothetical protein n=1 Tax=Streptomyces sp. NPDC048434 TaxID=3365549 RepID=UPI00370FD887
MFENADRTYVTVSTGAGKTYSLALVAYWHLMQSPPDVEEPDFSAADDFTPVPDDELERRLAEIDGGGVESLPEEIESISDSSLFLLEPQDRVDGSCAESGVTYRRPHLPSSFEQFHQRHVSNFPFSAEITLEKIRSRSQANSPIIFVSFNLHASIRAFPSKLTDKYRRPDSHHLNWRIREPYTHWREGGGDLKRKEPTHDDELFRQLRHAVWESITRNAWTILVDELEEVHDPHEALYSLISTATMFTTATASDGSWSLVFAAPPDPGVDMCRHYVGRRQPQLAVMELPGNPPVSNEQQNEMMRRREKDWRAELYGAVAALSRLQK